MAKHVQRPNTWQEAIWSSSKVISATDGVGREWDYYERGGALLGELATPCSAGQDRSRATQEAQPCTCALGRTVPQREMFECPINASGRDSVATPI